MLKASFWVSLFGLCGCEPADVDERPVMPRFHRLFHVMTCAGDQNKDTLKLVDEIELGFELSDHVLIKSCKPDQKAEIFIRVKTESNKAVVAADDSQGARKIFQSHEIAEVNEATAAPVVGSLKSAIRRWGHLRSLPKPKSVLMLKKIPQKKQQFADEDDWDVILK